MSWLYYQQEVKLALEIAISEVMGRDCWKQISNDYQM